eukprot:g1319.t1
MTRGRPQPAFVTIRNSSWGKGWNQEDTLQKLTQQARLKLREFRAMRGPFGIGLAMQFAALSQVQVGFPGLERRPEPLSKPDRSGETSPFAAAATVATAGHAALGTSDRGARLRLRRGGPVGHEGGSYKLTCGSVGCHIQVYRGSVEGLVLVEATPIYPVRLTRTS